MTLPLKAVLCAYVFLNSLVLSLLLAPLVRKLAFRFNILDQPGHRKSHDEPMPLLGGIAIFGSFTLVITINLCAFFIAANSPSFIERFAPLVEQLPRLTRVLPRVLAILLGGVVVTITGLVDDVKGVYFSPKMKLAGQILAATIAVATGIRTSFMPGVVLDWIISLLWVVGITNAFNFLDNTDGASAGIGAIAAIVLFGVVVLQGQVFTGLMLAVLAGSLIGFLPFNFHPASIFMGDTGSMFLGFVLSCLTLVGSYVVPGSLGLLPVILPLLVLGVPLFDMISVVYIRLRERRPIWVGDQRHFSHRLMRLGMSPRQSVIFLYLVTFGVGIGAALLPNLSGWQSALVLLQEIIIFTVIVSLMRAGRQRR